MQLHKTYHALFLPQQKNQSLNRKALPEGGTTAPLHKQYIRNLGFSQFLANSLVLLT
jgi:hypothetical protein